MTKVRIITLFLGGVAGYVIGMLGLPFVVWALLTILSGVLISVLGTIYENSRL